MTKRWQLLRDVGLAHGVIAGLGVLGWLGTEAVWLGSWSVGLGLAGSSALAQAVFLSKAGEARLGLSQGLKYLVFGTGAAGVMIFWREVQLIGFVLGIVTSQMLWAWAAARRSAKLLKAGQ